ncbi:MAG TPA: nucleotidyltransferase domain-containing protein, partial [Gallionellaceae bacterium]
MSSIAAIRDSLRAARAALQKDYGPRSRPARLLQAHAKLVDQHLRQVWSELAMPRELALAATGGYGRGELYPKSDIDLLILLPHEPDEELQYRLHELVQMLWDIGLEVGHSVRTVEQCVAESVDVTVQTNLLEARLLTGAQELFEEMRDTLAQHLDRRAFYLAKTQEQEKRYARYLDTDYNLEPNLKESPGGLRDLQNVLWISRACGLGDTWKELTQAGLITAAEASAIARHESLLQNLRIRLHFLAQRREDRLLFDYQTELAQQFGIAATATHLASEHLMQHYYRTKQAVQLLNAVLLQNMRARLFPEAGEIRPVNQRFVARGNLL